MIKIGTHNAIFHSDEIVAIALVSFLDEVEVVRTRSPLVLSECEFQVDVGGQYNPNEGRYDHHQFEEDSELYGKSSAGLVWLDVRDTFRNIYPSVDLTDLDTFIEAVDARDTHVNYDESNVYEAVFNAITACNHVEPMHKEQQARFEFMVSVVSDLKNYILDKDLEAYAKKLEQLEELAETYSKEKEIIFANRKNNAKILPEIIVSKFFDEWRSLSRATNKPIIMPGDKEGQFKIMIDTSNNKIVVSKDEVFTHVNGFISIVEPKETSKNLGVALLDGRLIGIPVKEVEEILSSMK